MSSLDASQQAFCNAPPGNIRLLAPAGCGKTHAILHRCQALYASCATRSIRFLVVTFTAAARDELKARLSNHTSFSQIRDRVEVTTLNSWGFRRIRSQTNNPRLLAEPADRKFAASNQLAPVWQRHQAVKEAITAARHPANVPILELMDGLKSLGFDHTRMEKYSDFENHLDELTSLGLSWKVNDLWAQLIKFEILKWPNRRKQSSETENLDLTTDSGVRRRVYDNFYKFWIEAVDHLIQSATFTFEDQKYYAYLDERQKARDSDKPLHGIARYDHVIVDEFQDINPLDLNLVRAIVERHRAYITIVGDDDQAIFEWRGTTPEYILHPEKFFGGTFATFTLGVNYRSPSNIVRMSQVLIRKNERRVDKSVRAHRDIIARIDVLKTRDFKDALALAMQLVSEQTKQGGSPTRIALISRKKAQLIPYQVFFASKNISFYAAEDLQIFLSATFDRLLKLLEIKNDADSPQRSRQVAEDLLVLCDLVKRFPVKKSEKEALRQYLLRGGRETLRDAVDFLASYKGPLKLPNSDSAISRAYANAIRSYLNADSVSKALEALSREFEGLAADFGKAEEDIFFKDPPFSQLAEYARSYGSDYKRFLADIQLAKEQLVRVSPFEDEVEDSSELQRRPVHLMTALRAKGKEFDTVMLLECVEDIWPLKHAATKAQLEAERRVFYVAFTRAKRRVVFQIPVSIGKHVTSPSRYLAEMGLTDGSATQATVRG